MPAESLAKRTDPVAAYNFRISLIDSGGGPQEIAGALAMATAPEAGFNECTGLEMTLDIEEYESGGVNGTVLKFPTRVKWNNITLKRGLARGTTLWTWFFGFVEGRGRRRDGLIVLNNASHQPHAAWAFKRGLPVKYTGPSMNATESSVAVESIEIAHEGLFQIPVPNSGN